jgi:hypothetical protein
VWRVCKGQRDNLVSVFVYNISRSLGSQFVNDIPADPDKRGEATQMAQMLLG